VRVSRKMVNEKNERFKRLATKRTNDLIEKIDVLSNLSEKRNYSYSQDEVEKMFKALNKALVQAKKKFALVNKTKVQI
jgi:hypothetical protein